MKTSEQCPKRLFKWPYGWLCRFPPCRFSNFLFLHKLLFTNICLSVRITWKIVFKKNKRKTVKFSIHYESYFVSVNNLSICLDSLLNKVLHRSRIFFQRLRSINCILTEPFVYVLILVLQLFFFLLCIW